MIVPVRLGDLRKLSDPTVFSTVAPIVMPPNGTGVGVGVGPTVPPLINFRYLPDAQPVP